MGAATRTAPTVILPPATKNRGKELVDWHDDVWKRIDAAVTEEMLRTRVAAKFLPLVHVPKNVTTVPSDVVIIPKPGDADQALSVEDTQTTPVNEYWIEFLLTPAQEHDEASEEMAMTQGQRCSTGVTLAVRSGNSLALAEDTALFNGQNAFNSSLFASGGLVQHRANLKANLDLGLLNIAADGSVTLPANQVVLVPPVSQGPPPRYAENTLEAVAQGFSTLQGSGHYEHYALVLNTIPYADLHTALTTTLITPVEPISHIVKAGVYGTATLPPFDGNTAGLPTTLPQGISLNGAKILYIGVLVSIAGNTMDLVRGCMDRDSGGKELDVVTICTQKDVNENYRFRVAERFALRLKDPTAVILLLFLDKKIQLAFGVQPTNTQNNKTIAPPVTVQVEDTNGNPVTGSTAAVTIAIGANPAGGTLSGTTTVNAVAGIATFSDLKIDKPGNGYTLVAASSGLSSATSASFNIS